MPQRVYFVGFDFHTESRAFRHARVSVDDAHGGDDRIFGQILARQTHSPSARRQHGGELHEGGTGDAQRRDLAGQVDVHSQLLAQHAGSIGGANAA